MKKSIFTILLSAFALCLFAQTTSVWNPAANPNSTGAWSEADNWTTPDVPDGDYKVVFNVPNAQECVLSDNRTITQMVLGDNGPGQTLRIANGGNLTTGVVWSAVGYNDTSRLIVETGGEITFGEHMWIGLIANGHGVVELNGGTINVSQMTGIGWDGGTGEVYVNEGVINMTGFHPTNSIKDGSWIDISNGTMVINGDQVGVIEDYVSAGRIIAFGGTGTISATYSSGNDVTTVAGVAGPQATTIWNPAGNPNTTGLWSEAENWTDGYVPDGNKVVFNVPDAQESVLDVTGNIGQLVAGDNGPGGTIRITNGGNLSTGVVWSAIGYNDTARLIVETGGEISFGEHMWVGLTPDGHGIVELNGGTINVAQMTGLGWDGGTAEVYVNDGIINMTGFDPNNSIKDGSFIDIGGGTISIVGDQVAAVEAYAGAGKIIAAGGSGSVMASFNSGSGLTTVVGGFSPQATTVWNPAGNPNSTGLWSEAPNWTDGFVPNDNKVVFNVPNAQDAILNVSSNINQLVMGDNGAGGTLIIGDGGVLNTGLVWSAIGYNDTARLVVETGGEFTFGEHMWLGFTPDGHGIVEVNGGTINVSQMTGLGWDGGTAEVYVNDGVINMNGFDPANSIKDGSVIDLTEGMITINGDQIGNVEAYVEADKITAYGGTGGVIVAYDEVAGKTIITAQEDPLGTVTILQSAVVTIQNFPNPFPASTTIDFTLAEATNIRLSISDYAGRTIAVLIDEARMEGTHRVLWNAEQVPVGTYFISIATDTAIVTKKINVLR